MIRGLNDGRVCFEAILDRRNPVGIIAKSALVLRGRDLQAHFRRAEMLMLPVCSHRSGPWRIKKELSTAHFCRPVEAVQLPLFE